MLDVADGFDLEFPGYRTGTFAAASAVIAYGLAACRFCFQLPPLRDQEPAVTRGRQPSSSKEIARFDHQDRRLLDPVRDASVHAAEQRDVILAAPQAESVRRGT